MFPLLKYSKEQIEAYFAQVTPEMVQATLGRGKLGFFDLLNLISPAAYPFMDAMRARAQKARRRARGRAARRAASPSRRFAARGASCRADIPGR